MIRYQDIIKSKDLRIKIVQSLGFIPDECMIKLQYFIKAKRRLNLRNPMRYTEKLQWYKLYYRDPVMTTCVDKHLVKEYVRNILGEEYIIPELFCWKSAEEIDFDLIPDNCVIKVNNGTGTNIFIKEMAVPKGRVSKSKRDKKTSRKMDKSSSKESR